MVKAKRGPEETPAGNSPSYSPRISTWLPSCKPRVRLACLLPCTGCRHACSSLVYISHRHIPGSYYYSLYYLASPRRFSHAMPTWILLGQDQVISGTKGGGIKMNRRWEGARAVWPREYLLCLLANRSYTEAITTVTRDLEYRTYYLKPISNQNAGRRQNMYCLSSVAQIPWIGMV